MIQALWVIAGVIVGMLISCVITPPTRKEVTVPTPHDTGVFHTDTGCIRVNSVEVPCGDESGSFNLLAVKQ
jgi:hypothetical protein